MSVSRLGFIAAGTGGAALALGASLPATAADAVGSASILALYKRPQDPVKFDAYYSQHHAPLAKTLPGLQSYTLSKGLGAKAPYYLVATLTFVSMDALNASLGSSQGKAVVDDLKNFATQAGVDIMTYENIPA